MADITYCGLACDNKDCERNYCHILGDDRHHSIAMFYECKDRKEKESEGTE